MRLTHEQVLGLKNQAGSLISRGMSGVLSGVNTPQLAALIQELLELRAFRDAVMAMRANPCDETRKQMKAVIAVEEANG